MLGARARAAEYNAYKAATARQASREAEEQKLPPKTVPVSLSAFTKNPLPNRNKGNKAWVPLILEDTPEGDAALSDNDGDADAISTPTRPTARVLVHTIERKTRPGVSTVQGLQPLRVNIPNFATPSAPKEMVTAQDRSAPLLNPTPRRLQSHSILKYAQHRVPSSLHSTPSSPGGYSLYPIPNYSWLFNLQGFPYTVQVPVSSSSEAFPFSSLMVPDDISPAKQENKLTTLSQVYANPSSALMHSQQPFLTMSGMDGHTLFPQYYPGDFITAPPVYGPSHQAGGGALDPSQRPELPHVNSDSIIPSDGEVFDAFTQPSPALTRHLSYPGPTNTILQQRQLIQQAASLAARRAGQRHTPEDEPYDRHSKMQKFVAAQQALAKTGKTVLHNPDLHRTKDEANSTTASTVTTKTVSSLSQQGSPPAYSEHHVKHELRAILKPPPGLKWKPGSRLIVPIVENASPLNSPSFEQLQEEFNVGSTDWFELKPMIKAERVQMKRLMKFCASAEDVDVPRILTSSSETDRLKTLRDDIQGRDEGNQVVRRAVDQIVEEYIAKRLSGKANDGLSVEETAAAVIESESIRAVGSIMMNIKDSSDPDAKEIDNARYFCKYKPAPEYAIERGRFLIGNMASTSYFEEETGGFYSAPSRIARDPRFRPPSKEGMKVKLDDDWKLRHDLYGRRRL